MAASSLLDRTIRFKKCTTTVLHTIKFQGHLDVLIGLKEIRKVDDWILWSHNARSMTFEVPASLVPRNGYAT